MIKLRRTTIEDVDLLLKLDKQPSTQKYLGGTKSIKEIIRTLELLGEYENGSQLPTKNSNEC